MAQHLSYGFTETNLYIDVPDTLARRSAAAREAADPERSLFASGLLRAVQAGTAGRLLVDTAAIGQATQEDAKVPGRTVHYLASIIDLAHPDEHDPALTLHMGVEHLRDKTRFGMTATVQWPPLLDWRITATATDAMQRAANDLRYMDDPTMVQATVGAIVERENGVTLQTNDVGGCSLGTDGNRYRPDDAAFRLDSDNVYSPVQQLICLHGLVAFAHAARQEFVAA